MKIFFEDLFCAPAEFRSIGPMAFTTAVVENMNKPKPLDKSKKIVNK